MPTFHAPLDRLAFSLSRCPKIRDRRTPPSVLASSPPPKRGDGSRHYLPRSSQARADQGCRKRRNQVPDWREIRCRFPPKSPAAFDRNHVPVCSDFCMMQFGRGGAKVPDDEFFQMHADLLRRDEWIIDG